MLGTGSSCRLAPPSGSQCQGEVKQFKLAGGQKAKLRRQEAPGVLQAE